MNILHVTAAYTPFVGGATTYLAEMSRRFARDGHAVTVLTTDIASIDLTWSPAGRRVMRAGDAPETIDGVTVARYRVRHLPAAPYSFYLLRRLMPSIGRVAPALMPALGALVPRLESTAATRRALSQGYDVVQLVNITMESVLAPAAALARSQRARVICTPFVHIGDARVMRNYVMPHQRDLMRRSDVVFAQTTLEQDALGTLGVDSARIRQLGMGVNLDDSANADGARAVAKHALHPGKPLVLFIGSITHDKGAVTLLQAMIQLWRAGVDATVMFVGDAPGPGGFAQALATTPPEFRDRIRTPGLLHGSDKHDALAAASVFAMPSRVDSFGIVYLEAWAHRKPVIGALAGGVPGVIDHGVDGALVPFGDATALAGCIRGLLEDPARAAAWGDAGRRKLASRYTWDRIYGMLRESYQT
jgi:glycosyltransferase involved in cell wall biosynthesis